MSQEYIDALLQQFEKFVVDQVDDEADSNVVLEDGLINILGAHYLPSDILKDDEAAYQDAFVSTKEKVLEDIRQTVFQEYPTPIAYHYYTACQESTYTLSDRFVALRDTWEILIHFLFAATIGELCQYQQPIRLTKRIMPPPSRKEHLLKWSLNHKIDTLRIIYKNAIEISDHRFAFQSLFDLDLLEFIRELNGARNEYAHSARKSDSQTRGLLTKYLEEVTLILWKLENLKEYTLMKYDGGTKESASKHICDCFNGRVLDADKTPLEFSASEIDQGGKIFKPNNIFVQVFGFYFSLKPWFHFIHADEGHSYRLCFFKKEGQYEVIGQSKNIESTSLPELDFDTALRQIEILVDKGYEE